MVLFAELHTKFISIARYYTKLFIKLFDIVVKIVEEIGHYCSTHCSMSYMSRLMASSRQGQSLSHCFARALFRTAIVLGFLAALLAIPAPVNSSARSLLISVHSCFASRTRIHDYRFSFLTALGAWSARDRIAQCT